MLLNLVGNLQARLNRNVKLKLNCFLRPSRHQKSKPEGECLDVIKNRKNTPTEKCLSMDTVPSLNPKKLMTTLLDLDQKLGSSRSLEQQVKSQGSKCARVVKNLNEFLNFTSLNKSKVIPSKDSELPINMSSGDGIIQLNHDESNSPDDLTDFFPMTTSITRELRLELESLDRQVKLINAF
jgi:hypothetical protein